LQAKTIIDEDEGNDQVADKLIEFDKEEKKKQASSISDVDYDVKNTFVDFRDQIFAQKLISFYDTKVYDTETKINHLRLSKKIHDMSSNKKFFELESIHKIIDEQYEPTLRMMFKMAALYLLLVLIPFVVADFITDKFYMYIIYSIGTLVQLFFLLNEVIQMRHHGLDYLSDVWNFIELTHYLTYIAYFIYFATVV
jgi:hypothetical protein